MSSERKAVITGIGILSPTGIGWDSYWEALIQGKTGFRPISLFDATPFRVKVGGEITDFDAVAFLGKKGLRTLDRSTRLLSAAAGLALEHASLPISEEDTYRMGVAVGTTFGSFHSISQFDRDGLTEGPRFVNPSLFPNTVINSPASQVSIRYRIKGFNTTVSTGFCSALDAMACAEDFIRLGRADAVLASSVEEFCEETFKGFHDLGCLSGLDGTEPMCCPFDARRDGLILSEGAAVLIMEDKERALSRNAAPMAELKGYGNSFDPSADMSFSHGGAGLSKAIQLALEDAGLAPEDIDFIAAGANSTKGLDRLETAVIKETFGRHAKEAAISSIKSMVGETFSASGGLAAAAAVGAIMHGQIPPTVNLLQRDPACDLPYVTEPTGRDVRNALVITSDPYGHNSALILGKTGE